MSTELHSVCESTFTVMGIPVRCHVLNDGSRVIEAESLANLFVHEVPLDGPAPDEDEEFKAMLAWMRGEK